MNGAPLTAMASRDEAGFQFQGFLRDDVFESAFDMLHVFERDLLFAALRRPARATARRVARRPA